MEDQDVTQPPSMSLLQAQSESADASQDAARSVSRYSTESTWSYLGLILSYVSYELQFWVPGDILLCFRFLSKAFTMSLSPQEIAYQEAHIDDDRRVNVVISMVICRTAAWIAVVLRLVSRRLAKCHLQMDDYMILVGLVRAEWTHEYFVRLTNSDIIFSSSPLGRNRLALRCVDNHMYRGIQDLYDLNACL